MTKKKISIRSAPAATSNRIDHKRNERSEWSDITKTQKWTHTDTNEINSNNKNTKMSSYRRTNETNSKNKNKKMNSYRRTNETNSNNKNKKMNLCRRTNEKLTIGEQMKDVHKQKRKKTKRHLYRRTKINSYKRTNERCTYRYRKTNEK